MTLDANRVVTPRSNYPAGDWSPEILVVELLKVLTCRMCIYRARISTSGNPVLITQAVVLCSLHG